MLTNDASPPLREGFTSGTAVTAAALAALELLCTGAAPEKVNVPLPPFPRDSNPVSHYSEKLLNVCISCAGYGVAPDSAIPPSNSIYATHAGVIKDAGDDPDVTHGLMFYATLMTNRQGCHLPGIFPTSIHIGGARGIGTVTKPGLALQPGEPAINPVPRQQLYYAVHQFLSARNWSFPDPLKLILSVPQGEIVACKTMNPQLGIVGGISILGTQGVVRPFSNKAWAETIRKQISCAKASGLDTLCLSTGRRSEALLKTLYPDLPDFAFIQIGDMAAFSFAECKKNNIPILVWGSFLGKLCKVAQGMPNTHANEQKLDLKLVEELCEKHSHNGCAHAIRHCHTAKEALEVLLQDRNVKCILLDLLIMAKKSAAKYGANLARIHLFHEDGRELANL